MADSFLTYTANDACERMHQIYTNYCPTKKRKTTAEKAQVTIRALQLKLAKRDGEDEAFLEWLQESPIDKDLVPNIKKKKVSETDVNWLHILIREIRNAKSCSYKTWSDFDTAWSAVSKLWQALTE